MCSSDLNYEDKGLGEGLRFGIPMGILLGLLQAGMYPYLPISVELAFAWFLGGLIQGIGIGLVLAYTYKN